MSDTALAVEGVSKKYRLGELHTNLLSERLSNLLRRKRVAANRQTGDFWALRDVSFELKEGEALGVIGRNGAGKSTLLKILSRLTAPTTGRASIRGRLASLLEVGTGFHPELSGRENIYLNGTILGMRRREIDQKFDEIVAFSGVEPFLETPVKHYSSGMYVRLAFAVAAHVEADILMLDEVLAVGDAEFQKRCLGRMGDVAKGGRTVLFVSHNLVAVRNLCTRAIVLDRGHLMLAGTVDECIAAYEEHNLGEKGSVWERSVDNGSAPLTITGIRSRLIGRQPTLAFEIDVTLETTAAHKAAFVAIDILDSVGTGILQAIPRLDGFIEATRGTHVVNVSIDLPPLIPGDYLASVWVGSHNNETLDAVVEAVTFEVRESPTPGRTFPHSRDHGHIVPRSRVSLT